MHTLYWERMAGSLVVQATLEALEADYVMEYVDMESEQHLTPGFLALNPAARIPALTFPDGARIGETAAIVTLLGEMHAAQSVIPRPGDPDRGPFLFWLNVMSTAGYVTSSRVGHPERFARDEGTIAQVKAQADRDFAELFALMDRNIAGEVSFLGRGLTALDFYVTMLSEWAGDRDALLGGLPRLRDLCTAVRETRAYRTALETHRMAAPEAQDA